MKRADFLKSVLWSEEYGGGEVYTVKCTLNHQYYDHPDLMQVAWVYLHLGTLEADVTVQEEDIRKHTAVDCSHHYFKFRSLQEAIDGLQLLDLEYFLSNYDGSDDFYEAFADYARSIENYKDLCEAGSFAYETWCK